MNIKVEFGDRNLCQYSQALVTVHYQPNLHDSWLETNLKQSITENRASLSLAFIVWPPGLPRENYSCIATLVWRCTPVQFFLRVATLAGVSGVLWIVRNLRNFAKRSGKCPENWWVFSNVRKLSVIFYEVLSGYTPWFLFFCSMWRVEFKIKAEKILYILIIRVSVQLLLCIKYIFFLYVYN